MRFLKSSIKALLLFLLVIFSSCDYEEKEIIGNYYSVAIDVPQNRQLSYKLENGGYIGIVEPYLNKVGITDDYLIAVQNPVNTFIIDSTTYRYFMVPIKKENTLRPEEGILGPMTKKEFLEKARVLNIGNVQWKNYD